jgi:hypothetical protein
MKARNGRNPRPYVLGLERETGVETATSTLAKWMGGPATIGDDRSIGRGFDVASRHQLHPLVV